MIKILIADDHPVVRSGIRNLLRDDATMRVSAEAKTAAEVLQKVRTQRFDVVLLDIGLPDGSGIDLIPLLRTHAPDVQVVMFTNLIGEANRCLAAGAAGFLSKDAPGDDVKRAIAAAATRTAAASGSGQPNDASPQFRAYERLSARELEIMLKLIAGHRNKEIGLELGISEKTVATHRARMLKKLGLTDMRSLILFAMHNGLADWSS